MCWIYSTPSWRKRVTNLVRTNGPYRAICRALRMYVARWSLKFWFLRVALEVTSKMLFSEENAAAADSTLHCLADRTQFFEAPVQFHGGIWIRCCMCCIDVYNMGDLISNFCLFLSAASYDPPVILWYASCSRCAESALRFQVSHYSWTKLWYQMKASQTLSSVFEQSLLQCSRKCTFARTMSLSHSRPGS